MAWVSGRRVPAGYFAILAALALWVRDIPGQPALGASLADVIRTSELGDPVTFATAALDIAANGWISAANEWIFNLWPPGFVLLEAAAARVLGPDGPVLLALQLLAAGLFAWVLSRLQVLVRPWVPAWAALLAPLLIFAFPVARVFLLQPIGISLGESFSIGFFLAGLLLAAESLQGGSLRRAVGAGLCLGASAYFRSQFELFVMALTGWGALLAAWAWGSARRRIGEGAPELRRLAVTVLVVLGSAHALMLPWRSYHAVHGRGFKWVLTSTYTFRGSVTSTEDLLKANGSFAVEGGANLTCRIDPSTCGRFKEAKRLTIRTFLAHPLQWYGMKGEIVGRYWSAPVGNWVNVKLGPEVGDRIVNGMLLLLLGVGLLPLAAPSLRRHPLLPLLLWFQAAVFSAHALIFTLVHFEVRYFFFLKIYGVAMAILVVALLVSRRPALRG